MAPPPRPPAFIAAESQLAAAAVAAAELDDDDGPPGSSSALAGLDLPLLLMLRPGLAQPPPGMGDGLLERDMAVLGVPAGAEGRIC